MTKLGWCILSLIVLVVLAFGSMLSTGTSGGGASPIARVKARFEPVVPRGAAFVIPVAGVARSALTDTWGDDRGGDARRHEAIDIVAAGGTPVLAAVPGTVDRLFQSAAGGTTVYIRSRDRGWSYYYAHLMRYAPGLHEGQVIRAGQQIGYVGDTGNAGAGNYHLHFAVTRMRAGDGWWQGQPVNPYPLLAGSGPRR